MSTNPNIKAGDVVARWERQLWNVSQVHVLDFSADIWRMVDGQRVERNVSINSLRRVTN